MLIKNSSFKIKKRFLNQEEVLSLVREIRKTPFISAYSSKEWLQCSNVLVAENEDGKLLGACLNDDFSKDWSEIAALFVHKQYRNQGIGKSLFHASYHDSISRKKNVLVISSNPLIVKIMSQLEFDLFSSLIILPDPYKKHQVALVVLYNLRWLTNIYRISEVLRKKIMLGRPKKAIYGLKLNS